MRQVSSLLTAGVIQKEIACILAAKMERPIMECYKKMSVVWNQKLDTFDLELKIEVDDRSATLFIRAHELTLSLADFSKTVLRPAVEAFLLPKGFKARKLKLRKMSALAKTKGTPRAWLRASLR